MGFMGRGSEPAQYADFISTVGGLGLTIPTPAPQFFFAKAAMGGRLRAAAIAAGLSGPRALVDIIGGGKPIPELEPLLTMDEQIPGLINVVEELDAGRKGEGDTITFERQVYSVGGLGENDRKLIPAIDISTTGRTVRLEQVPMTLGEYHGPYASGGSGVAPFEVRQFDAKYRANKIQLGSQVAHHLSYDYTNWLDAALVAKFCRATNASAVWSSADTTYLTFPGTQTAVTEFVAGGGATFNCEQLLRARQTLRDRYIPPFANGRYVSVVPTSWNTHMLGDVQYRELSKYHSDGRNQIFGYITSIEDVDIYECNTLPTYAAAGTYGGGTVPTGVAIAEGFICGPGSVGFGCTLAPELRFSDSTNYQTLTLLIWYAIQAQGVLDDRYVERFCAQTT